MQPPPNTTIFDPAALGGLVLLLAVAAALALAFRAARLPGAAVAGGLLAGLLLGPGTFGRIAPGAFDRLYAGAAAELAEHRAAEHRLGATLFALGAAPDAVPDRAEIAELEAEVERTGVAWRAARERHRRPLALGAIVLAALALGALGAARLPRAARTPDRARPLLLGAWLAAVPAILACVALAWFGEPRFGATMLAAAATVAVGAWPLGANDRRIAEEAFPGGLAWLRGATLVATAVAAILLFVAATRTALPLAVPAAATLGTAFLAGVAVSRLAPDDRMPAWPERAIALVAPGLAALAASSVEPFLDFRLWPALVLALVAHDGRWTAAALGAWLPGGVGFAPAWRLGLAAMPAGAGMVALLAVALVTGLMAAPVGLGLLLGVALGELLGPVRVACDRSLRTGDESAT